MKLGKPRPTRERSSAPALWAGRALLLTLLLVCAAAVAAQRGGGFGGGRRVNEAAAFRGIPDRPAGFTFCRLYFTAVRSDPSGTGWAIEYPDAELHFMTRLSQFTTTHISRWVSGEVGSTVVRATDRELFQCPFVMMSSPGSAGFSDEEAAGLRAYLLKGGFLWGDDFWGNGSWAHWSSEIARVLPEYPIQRIDPSHSIFTSFYQLSEVPQIPALQRWRPGMSTSELGEESAVPTMSGIFDDRGRLLVLMTHNTDIADGWEREDDLESFFEAFAAKAYGIGINVAVWTMSH